MSGPKVVRVVTREELEAICNRLASQVRAAAADLVRTLKRTNLYSDDLAAGIEARISTLSNRIAKGDFGSVQREAPAVAAFFRQETARYLQIAIEIAEKNRLERQRLTDAARSVRDVLEQQGKPVPAELNTVIQHVRKAKSGDLTQMRQVVDSAMRTLSTSPPTGSVASASLAASLSRGLASQGLADWMKGSTQNALPNQLSKGLAELEVLGGEAVVDLLRQRIAAIEDEPSSDRRRLLSDSLLIDVAGQLKTLRREREKRAELSQLLSELEAFPTMETADLRAQINSMLAAEDLDRAEGILTAGRKVIDDAALRLAATSRRQAVLQGLASLGYEVRAGMETAWAAGGTVVVSRPNALDYGIELGAPQDASRLQMRVVAAEHPATPRNRQRDIDQENMWCGQVGDLITSLATAGTEIVIERSQPVGAQPLKTTALLGISSAEVDASQPATASKAAPPK